jgi:acetylornithine deacetylase/succinyl-diaminopimelate desuccinylase-like protein
MWSRPCCDVNGIWAGYTGAGAKTVIPAVARAKVSFRLVAAQEPEEVIAGARAFLQSRLPPECTLSVTVLGRARPAQARPATRFLEAAQSALAQVFGRAPVLRGGAGTLPLVSTFREILGLECLLMGFGLADDRVHAPNEKFELVCFRKGILSHLSFLANISG